MIKVIPLGVALLMLSGCFVTPFPIISGIIGLVTHAETTNEIADLKDEIEVLKEEKVNDIQRNDVQP